MLTKRCNKCGETKPLSEFHKNKAYSDGYLTTCKECRSVYARRYYAANREKCRASRLRYQKANPEKPREWRRRWRERNPNWEGKVKRVKRTCEECGKEFEARLSEVRKGGGRFCSSACTGKAQRKRIRRTCKYCGKEFESRPSEIKRKGRGRYCSRACADKAKEGSGGPMWKGGLSFEPYPPEFNRALKRSIRERDSYTCQICGDRENGRHHAVHHIDYDKQNNSPDNLILLCYACHAKTNSNREYWQVYFTGGTMDDKAKAKAAIPEGSHTQEQATKAQARQGKAALPPNQGARPQSTGRRRVYRLKTPEERRELYQRASRWVKAAMGDVEIVEWRGI